MSDGASAWLAQGGQVWTPTSIPRPIGRERIILHAFSGRRRPGDYQWYLEHLLSTGQEGLSLYVVSLDIVIDSKYGDLADPETRGFWLSHIFQGFVHGFLGGPPCCTFSKARAVKLSLSDSRRAPRPVRSATELWGSRFPASTRAMRCPGWQCALELLRGGDFRTDHDGASRTS